MPQHFSETPIVDRHYLAVVNQTKRRFFCDSSPPGYESLFKF